MREKALESHFRKRIIRESSRVCAVESVMTQGKWDTMLLSHDLGSGEERISELITERTEDVTSAHPVAPAPPQPRSCSRLPSPHGHDGPWVSASEKPRTAINWEMWVPAEAGSCRATPVWSWWLQNVWSKRWSDGAQEVSRTSLTTDVNYLSGFSEQSTCLINETYFYYQTQFLWITHTLRSHYIKWYKS